LGLGILPIISLLGTQGLIIPSILLKPTRKLGPEELPNWPILNIPYFGLLNLKEGGSHYSYWPEVLDFLIPIFFFFFFLFKRGLIH